MIDRSGRSLVQRKTIPGSRTAPRVPEASEQRDGATGGRLCGDAFTAVLDGEVDLCRREELRALVERFRQSGMAHAVLDVHEVDFIDSTGLSALLAMTGIAEHRHGRVHLVGPQRQFRRVLELSGVGHLVDVQAAP